MMRRAAIALAVAALPATAEAQRDGSWIEKNPKFTRPKSPTVHCSGAWHCKPVSGRVIYRARRVCEITSAGLRCAVRVFWRVDGMSGEINQHQTYPSIDGQPWACMDGGNVRTMTGGYLACLFLPGARN